MRVEKRMINQEVIEMMMNQTTKQVRAKREKKRMMNQEVIEMMMNGEGGKNED